MSSTSRPICDFSFGSIVNRSPLVIGISTDGAAPVFAQAIRAKLEALLPQGFAAWAAAAARWRAGVKASGLSFAGRRKFWQLFTAHAVANPDSEPSETDFKRFIAEVAGQGPNVESGSVTLVGAGPGDPELLTLRAVRALQSADVILFDDLVSRDVLDFARREARKMLVGKTGYGPSCKQDDINALMVSLARQGKRVVRLKGGDPLIFARAGEEIDACRKPPASRSRSCPASPPCKGRRRTSASRLPIASRARRLQVITGHARNGQLPARYRLAQPCRPGHHHRGLYAGEDACRAGRARAGRRPRSADAGARRCPRHAARSADIRRADRRVCRSGLAKAALPGPLLVIIGRVTAEAVDVRNVAAGVAA